MEQENKGVINFDEKPTEEQLKMKPRNIRIAIIDQAKIDRFKKERETLEKTTLSNGQNALDYVNSLPQQHREVAKEAILECLRLGYPLNNLEITRIGREINRKRMGIK